jgi:hypothetical protein
MKKFKKKFCHKRILSNSLWIKTGSKKWLGPIFANTRNLILVTITTPAVLIFYTNSKYLEFFQFIISHLKPKIWENWPDVCKKSLFFKKSAPPPKKASDLIEKLFIRYIISENRTVDVSSSSLQNVEFGIFFKRNIVDACLFVLFFHRGECIKPKVQDNWEGAHSKVNLKLLFKRPYRLDQGKVLFSFCFRLQNYNFTPKRMNLQSI